MSDVTGIRKPKIGVKGREPWSSGQWRIASSNPGAAYRIDIFSHQLVVKFVLFV